MKVRNNRPSRSKASGNRAVRPVVEGLEGRFLLYAVTGNHFNFGSRITWSIEPDGASMGSVPSNLISSIGARFDPAYLVRAAQDAFAVWENVANVNFAQVSDDGESTNAGAYQQGSPTIGDIRIGGFAQDPGVLGFCLLPPPSNGASDSGDIFLNTSLPWQIGSDYDLESVLIHEIGHALGMGHSTDTGAAMNPYYNGVHQYVNSDDVAGVRSIWGARQEDYIYANNVNTVASRAPDLAPYRNSQNQVSFGGLDVANTGESYWFKVTTPANASNNLNVVIQSTNLSELSPKVQLYDSNLRGLVQNAAAAGVYGATVGVSIGNATPNTTYYIKVSGSNAGVTGTGNYGILVNMGSSPLPTIPPPNTVVYAQPDKGGGGINDVTATSGGGTSNGASENSQGSDDQGDGSGKGKHAGSSSTDKPTWIRVGDHVAQGDYYEVAPAKSTAPAAATTSTTDPSVAYIPLDPGQSSDDATRATSKRDGVAVLVRQAHPVGPA